MKLTSLFSSFLVIGLLSTSSFSLASNETKQFTSPKEEASNTKISNVAYPQEGATELSSDDMIVNVTSSTTTECSQAYQVTFSSSITTYSNRTKNVYVTITDSNFTKYDDYPTLKEGATLPEFEAQVYAIKDISSGQENVIIPRYLQYTTRFKMHITGCYSSNIVDTTASSKIKSILIHSDLVSIPSGAFNNIPDTVTLKCMDTAPQEGWSNDWTDAKNITYGYAPTEDEISALDTTRRAVTQTPGTGKDYIIGYYGEDKYNLPLVLGFTVTKLDGTKEKRIQDLELSSTNSIYDGVGEGLGSAKTSKNIDISLNSGEKIDNTTLVFYNIYGYTRDSSDKIIPNIDGSSYYAKASLSYSGTYDLSDIITYKEGRASIYSGYTQVDLSISKTPGVYKILKPTIYEQNKAEIDSGALIVRYRLTSFSIGKYQITYKDGSETKTALIPVSSPVDYYLLNNEKNNEVGFILPDAKTDETTGTDYSFGGFSNIESMNYVGMYVTLDLFKSSNSAIISKSSVSLRFGIVPMVKDKASFTYTDINALVIRSVLIYTLCFAVLAVAYFFYKKRRYRNDEFRRVKPKQYLKSSIINYFGFGLLTLSIVYIVARFGIMDTSIVAYNPLDVYVIIFSVAGLIFLGVTIKNLVVAIKNNAERKRAIRLHLGNDVIDDGTGIK